MRCRYYNNPPALNLPGLPRRSIALIPRASAGPATRFIVEELEFVSSLLLVHITPVSSGACSNLMEPRQIIHVRIFSDCTVYGGVCLSGWVHLAGFQGFSTDILNTSTLTRIRARTATHWPTWVTVVVVDTEQLTMEHGHEEIPYRMLLFRHPKNRAEHGPTMSSAFLDFILWGPRSTGCFSPVASARQLSPLFSLSPVIPSTGCCASTFVGDRSFFSSSYLS